MKCLTGRDLTDYDYVSVRKEGFVPISVVIPRSKKEGTKPPYVCPGCSNHTHGNN
jgi:hypothetical protein